MFRVELGMGWILIELVQHLFFIFSLFKFLIEFSCAKISDNKSNEQKKTITALFGLSLKFSRRVIYSYHCKYKNKQ